jgi:hypothetical protein
MLLTRSLVFLLSLVALSGCHRSRGTTLANLPAVVAAAVLGGGPVALDPYLTLALVGTLTLCNELPVGTASGDIRFRVEVPAGSQAETNDVLLAPGELRAVQVFTTLALAAVLTATVHARYERGGDEREFPVSWQNAAGGNSALRICQLLGSGQLATIWYASLLLTPVGLLTRNSNPLVPQRLPQLAQEIRLIGALIGYFTLLELQAAFGPGIDTETFPIGQGPEGFTVAATPPAALADGQYCAFWMSTAAAIPIADPSRFYQYAFVVDSDANPANNYQPAPAFPDDFFGGTDRWYELNHAPATGWQLRCRVVGPGNTLTVVPTGARAILRDDTWFLLVPRSEFVIANPPFRATSFGHPGDFGQNPPHDWSGDPTPTVAEGLRSWQ